MQGVQLDLGSGLSDDACITFNRLTELQGTLPLFVTAPHGVMVECQRAYALFSLGRVPTDQKVD